MALGENGGGIYAFTNGAYSTISFVDCTVVNNTNRGALIAICKLLRSERFAPLQAVCLVGAYGQPLSFQTVPYSSSTASSVATLRTIVRICRRNVSLLGSCTMSTHCIITSVCCRRGRRSRRMGYTCQQHGVFCELHIQQERCV